MAKYLNIAKYSNIFYRIFKSIKLNIRDESRIVAVIKYKKLLDGSLFLIISPGLIAQVLSLKIIYYSDINTNLYIIHHFDMKIYLNIALYIIKSDNL